MQPVLVGPDGSVLQGPPVGQDGATAQVAPFTDGTCGSLQIARGPGVEPELYFFEDRAWFQYLAALAGLERGAREASRLDGIFQRVAAGGSLMAELAAHADASLHVEGPEEVSCWVLAPGAGHGLPETILVSDVADPHGRYEDGRVPPDPFPVTLHRHGGDAIGYGVLDLPAWPADDDDIRDFRDLLRTLGKRVLVDGEPLDAALRDVERQPPFAAAPSTTPGP